MSASTPALIPSRSETSESVLALIAALEEPGDINVGMAKYVSANLRAYLCESVPDRAE